MIKINNSMEGYGKRWLWCTDRCPPGTKKCHKSLVRIAGLEAKTEPRTSQTQIRSETH
jgi:hypothetical protein